MSITVFADPSGSKTTATKTENSLGKSSRPNQPPPPPPRRTSMTDVSSSGQHPPSFLASIQDKSKTLKSVDRDTQNTKLSASAPLPPPSRRPSMDLLASIKSKTVQLKKVPQNQEEEKVAKAEAGTSVSISPNCFDQMSRF